MICTNFSNGKKHDFRLFKESKVRWVKEVCDITDSGLLESKRFKAERRFRRKKEKASPYLKKRKKKIKS